MLQISEIVEEALRNNSSDVHITVGRPPVIRQNGKITLLNNYPCLTSEDTKELARSIVPPDRLQILEQEGDIDFAYSKPGVCRCRINVYKQRLSYAISIRILISEVPTLSGLGMPASVGELASKQRGLVLVTGSTGSGKSTTLAAMINQINQTRQGHIITIEDPIEYLHRHGTCIVNQREIGEDTPNYQRALRSALREDPDVILLGEMRDMETISAAISAAETGHLVLSTLHTKEAVGTIDRIIDVFPPFQQRQIRVQLSSVLEGVIAQNLVLRADGKGRMAAMEILLVNDAIRNLIRDEKSYQINSTIQTSIQQGMQTMDYHLAKLAKQGLITRQEARYRAVRIEDLNRYLNMN